MKIVIGLAAAALTFGAADMTTDSPAQSAATIGNGRVIHLPNANSAKEAVCRDRIRMVRAERGLPMLQRETASPDEPLFIAAIDHRLDGCGVLVMRNDTSDIRPVPAPPENQPLFQPAR